MKSPLKLYWVLLALLTVATTSRAAVLHVPSNFATIQSALDATATFDTVLVAPGRYHEFLVGPLHSYNLHGQHAPDSVTEELWTVLDPIPLPNADTPSTFVARGDTVRVRNFVFFNRPEMRQLEWPTRTGGIRNQADLLEVERCRFDSVSSAIERGPHIRASHCAFRGCLWKYIWTELHGQLEAQFCSFDGVSGYAYILAYDSSRIESCIFGCNPAGHFLQASGRYIQIRGCRLGPCDGNLSTVYIYAVDDCVIEQCEFVGMEDMFMMLEVSVDCHDEDFPPIIVRDNTFLNFTTRNNALKQWCIEGTNGYLGLLDRNSFVMGVGSTIPGAAVSISGSALMRDNRFEEIRPEGTADVYAHTITASGTLTARDNLFLGPGLGAATGGPPFDARWNWWGDSTGPYSASENPEGLGTEVGWGVQFQPWLTSPPDTIGDTSEVAVEAPPSVLASYALHAYPNPFNAMTTLEIEVVMPGEYAVLLYDVTGRETARVFSGRIERSTRVALNASEFASGVYFVKLARGSEMFAVEKVLLVK